MGVTVLPRGDFTGTSNSNQHEASRVHALADNLLFVLRSSTSVFASACTNDEFSLMTSIRLAGV